MDDRKGEHKTEIQLRIKLKLIGGKETVVVMMLAMQGINIKHLSIVSYIFIIITYILNVTCFKVN